MAGIANTKQALQEIRDLLKVASLVFEDGKLTLLDFRHAPSAISDGMSLAKAVSAAVAAGEFQDIDGEEAEEIWGILIELVLQDLLPKFKDAVK
jgi:hypothetical protein